ncbi:MAG: C4-dicarboxylate ABC transporter permease [Comamonadaceae bacterium CG1_02_60_18]|nr:MAG: C4-dicarboxylate ABC transporter permease [Comamonadaceae bacterium CG1_02_60_18]PIQ55616.1 MAG: C4-dicarboxylate ABC transporter permease [Comamonadaceae bacterium CG12_big_fil_rev_8_21_14_0_65_59_15]
MNTVVLFATLFFCMAIGMPIAVSLGLSSLVTIFFFSQDSLASMSIKLFETSEHYTLMSIPFFVLAGALMSTGGVAKRMVTFAIDAVGHLRGGLAIASILACMLFAAVSGSSPATVVAIGSIVIGGMVKNGYPKEFAAGVICNAGTLGILIPPSIVMVVYCAVTEESVGRIFMAGVVPGLLLGFMLMFAVWWRAGKLAVKPPPKVSFGELMRSFRESMWGLALLVIIMGGIYGGIFTPTEAAAVSAVYALVVAVFIYRDLNMKQLPHVFLDAARTTVMLMFIVCNALLFAHVLTTERIPQTIAEQIVSMGMTPWMFLLVVNVILLVAGNFMEPTGIILILAPIFFPISKQLGIDPIHLGVIMVVNMEIGMVTPPVGLNLFVTSGVTGMNLVQVTKAALPWLMVLLTFLAMVTYIPAITLTLPDMIFGKAL